MLLPFISPFVVDWIVYIFTSFAIWLVHILTSFAHWLVFTSDRWLKFVQIIALVIAGFGAYVKFFKVRIYKSRLELSVTGTTTLKNNTACITAIASIKNIGQTKLDIDPVQTSLRLCYCEPLVDPVEASKVHWEHIATFDVFEGGILHKSDGGLFIESGETVQDQVMLIVPGLDVASFHLELNVCAGEQLWKARIIITPEEKAKPSRKRIIL